MKENVPRFLINREPVGPFRFYQMDCCFRDVVLLNDCDRGVQKLCDLIGWRSELEDLYTKGREKLLKQQQAFFEMKKAVAESVTEPVNCFFQQTLHRNCPSVSHISRSLNSFSSLPQPH